MRAQLNKTLEAEGIKLSVNDFILKASAEALRQGPRGQLLLGGNGDPPARGGPRLLRRRDRRRAHHPGHPRHRVEDADAISTEAKSLAKRAKEKKLAPAEFTGGTFCVSNLGMMGIDRFSAIINPPNGAILAVGATVAKPVVKDGQIAIGQRMSLTLSCDHRVVDGAVGATFLAALRELIEKPALLVL